MKKKDNRGGPRIPGPGKKLGRPEGPGRERKSIVLLPQIWLQLRKKSKATRKGISEIIEELIVRFLDQVQKKDPKVEQVFKKAVEVFGDTEVAEKWMHEKAYGLGDVTPVDYIMSKRTGYKDVEDLLDQIDV